MDIKEAIEYIKDKENVIEEEPTEGHYRVKEPKMRVFISQPMRDRTVEQIEERRDQICEFLVEVFNRDIEFIDSISKDPELIKKGSVAMLGHSISLMADADLVVFDDCEYGYSGVYIEREVADTYQIPKIDIYELCTLYAGVKGLAGAESEEFKHIVCSYYNSGRLQKEEDKIYQVADKTM